MLGSSVRLNGKAEQERHMEENQLILEYLLVLFAMVFTLTLRFAQPCSPDRIISLR